MPVKVTRSGNSTMLPLPADLARAAHAELADNYPVELLGDHIVYHRSSEHATIAGSGSSRVGVVPDGRAMRMTGRFTLPPLDD